MTPYKRAPSLTAQLLQLPTIALASYILLSGTSLFWKMEVSTPQLLLIALLSAGFGWLAWRQGWLALLLLLLPATLLPLVARLGRPDWVVHLDQTLRVEVADFIKDVGVQGPMAGFGGTLGLTFLALVGLGFGAVAARESLGRGRAFLTLLFGAVVFGSQWTFFWEPSAGYGMAFAAVAFLLWILAGTGQREAAWAASGRKVQYQTPLTAPLAGVLLVALGARILPMDFLPSTASLFSAVTEQLPFLEQLRGNKVGAEFGLLSTGFSPNGSTLGGPVQTDDKPALEIRVPTIIDRTLYLRGAVYEQFNGTSWRQADEAHAGFSAPTGIPSYQNPSAFGHAEKIRITHLQSWGRSLFSPQEAVKVEGQPWEVDGTQMLRSTKAVKKNGEYTVSVQLPDWSAEQIRAFERQALGLAPPPGFGGDQQNGTKFEIDRTAPLQPPGVLPTGMSATFSPTAVNRPIRDLTARITAGAETPYEKAIALESWLRQAFPYDLKAPAPRGGQNFVEFFLFQAQRGYCTYFASAMTLMLQASGVQARLVEGFALPSTAGLTRGADGTAAYVVTNAMAHAWVEAWIPGYGWVTFDPTPRSDIPVADRSRPLVAPTTPVGPGDPGSTNPTDPANDPKLNPRNQEDPGIDTAGSAGSATRARTNWALTAALAGLLALIGAMLMRLRLQAPRPVVAGRTGVTETWSKAEGLLHRFDWGRKASQTPAEWATQVGARVGDLNEPLKMAANDYTVARWGPPSSQLDAAAPSRATTLWHLATQAMRQRYGTLLYLWRRLRPAPPRK